MSVEKRQPNIQSISEHLPSMRLGAQCCMQDALRVWWELAAKPGRTKQKGRRVNPRAAGTKGGGNMLVEWQIIKEGFLEKVASLWIS